MSYFTVKPKENNLENSREVCNLQTTSVTETQRRPKMIRLTSKCRQIITKYLRQSTLKLVLKDINFNQSKNCLGGMPFNIIPISWKTFRLILLPVFKSYLILIKRKYFIVLKLVATGLIFSESFHKCNFIALISGR